MTPTEFKLRFPRASESTIAANCDYQTDTRLPGPEPQRAIPKKPLAAAQGESKGATRPTVRITSCRVRPIDPDNLCPKYLIDALRYCGALRDDREADYILQITQEKVTHKQQELTKLEIQYP